MPKQKPLDATKILDELEDIIINSIIPVVREIKKHDFVTTEDEKTIARNLVGKIGVRIMFGKDIDSLLVGEDVKK